MNRERYEKIRALAEDPAAFPGERENALRILARERAKLERELFTPRPTDPAYRPLDPRGYQPPPTRDERIRQAFASAFTGWGFDVVLEGEGIAGETVTDEEWARTLTRDERSNLAAQAHDLGADLARTLEELRRGMK